MAVLKQTSPTALPGAPKPTPSKKLPSASMTPPRDKTVWVSAIGNVLEIGGKIGMQARWVNLRLSQSSSAFSTRCLMGRFRLQFSFPQIEARDHVAPPATERFHERRHEGQGRQAPCYLAHGAGGAERPRHRRPHRNQPRV